MTEPATAQSQNQTAQQEVPRKSRKNQIDEAVYDITFSGTYFAASSTGGGGGGTTEKSYTIEVKIKHGDIANNNESAKSIFKNVIAPEVMPIAYPDYIALYTYHIVKSKCDNPDLLANNLPLLTKEGLIELIDDLELPINPHLYDTAEDLRVAIDMAQKDPEGYARREAQLNATKGGKAELKKSVLDLNAQLKEKLLAQKKEADTPSSVTPTTKPSKTDKI